MENKKVHIPVLKKEVLKYLKPGPNENFIDCTVGGGGHALAILKKNGPEGKVLGIDRDPELIKNLEYRILKGEFKKRLILVCDNYTNLKEILKKTKFGTVSGILFDLGMSSWHLENSKRGFSFLRNEPLDMRYSFKNLLTPLEVNGARQKHKENKPLTGLTAEGIVNRYSQKEIETILKEYGQEQFAPKISRKIIEERKKRLIKSTFQLVEIIKKAVPSWYQKKRIHPATKTFQALRIAVNDELNNLKLSLPQALDVLKPKGRLVIISFHSLEDKIVKNFFREQNKEEIIQIITKKPIQATIKEIKINPRSRSAKLRAAIKISI